jgi:multiple sugar transport system ATP-binding protein
MVFQNYALYPHMTVRDNMGFALKLGQGRSGRDRQQGQRRGRHARAQAAPRPQAGQPLGRPAPARGDGPGDRRDPKCFLMDEPLSNLDAKLRVQMRTQVSRIQQTLKTTMVYVTHDQTEAMTLGDRVAVMRAGIIQQVDSPKVLYEDPANCSSPGFIGSPAMNFVRALESDTLRCRSATRR